MASAGHVLIGAAGEFIDVDTEFGAIMRSPPQALVGRAVMDVTAPADRSECALAIERLRETHRPFTISKRFQRDDGSLVWVVNSVSITHGASRGPIIMATIDPIDRPEVERSPAALFESAQLLKRLQSERAQVCGPELMTGPGWDMMLAAYIVEAEGLSVDLDALAARCGTSMRSAGRWMMVLVEEGLLELELSQDPYAAKSFRLTRAAHRRFERYLAAVSSTVAA